MTLTHEVSHAMFEGLFARAVTVSAELARELKSCGYDVANPDAGASGAVFSARRLDATFIRRRATTRDSASSAGPSCVAFARRFWGAW